MLDQLFASHACPELAIPVCLGGLTGAIPLFPASRTDRPGVSQVWLVFHLLISLLPPYRCGSDRHSPLRWLVQWWHRKWLKGAKTKWPLESAALAVPRGCFTHPLPLLYWCRWCRKPAVKEHDESIHILTCVFFPSRSVFQFSAWWSGL